MLVNGATGTAGRLAVQIAKYLGVAKVIATARNLDALKSIGALGADVTIPLVEDETALEKAFRQQFAAGVFAPHDVADAADPIVLGTCRPAPPSWFAELGRLSLPIGIRTPLREATEAFAHVRRRDAGRALLIP